jgi:hypothetical protein
VVLHVVKLLEHHTAVLDAAFFAELSSVMPVAEEFVTLEDLTELCKQMPAAEMKICQAEFPVLDIIAVVEYRYAEYNIH